MQIEEKHPRYMLANNVLKVKQIFTVKNNFKNVENINANTEYLEGILKTASNRGIQKIHIQEKKKQIIKSLCQKFSTLFYLS